METNNTTRQSFVQSFESVSENLAIRYRTNMYLDFIQEFIKFADNTRDIYLQEQIENDINYCSTTILQHIAEYERNNKKDACTDSN